jgi:AAA15 family ATPase/GTPase
MDQPTFSTPGVPTIKNFRNLDGLDISLVGGVIVGENRVGKSNPVHAIRVGTR